MKNARIILFYASIFIAGIFLFLTIRWFVLNGNPMFYESTNRRVLTPEEVKSTGIAYEADKQYYQIETKKTFLRSGRFPLIQKEISVSTELEVVPDDSGK